MRPTEFFSLLETGKAGPVYFLRGPDRFLHEECLMAVRASLPAETREWCFAKTEFKPGELHQLLDDADQMPMLGEHSFLYVTDEDDFGHAADEDTAALENFLKRPPAFATVCFAAYEPDRRRRFVQLLEKKAQLVELSPLALREASAWLTNYLRKAGVQIQPELAERIASRFDAGPQQSGRAKAAGVNLLWLRTEVEKLLVARSGTKRIEESDLDLIVTLREEHEIGKLLGAIAERRLSPALALLHDLLSSKEPEVLLLWSIGDLFRQALKSAPGAPTRYGPWSRPSNPYSTYEIAPRSHRAYSRDDLARAIRLVREADLAIKSSWKDSKVLLECLLWQIMSGSAAAPARGAQSRAV
ncbi:MAG TPA: DNA polymerase III subunit delta [Terriglobia bacterium]|nr:DNA polymerase III subunit delta [Terriglobia bacterium]